MDLSGFNLSSMIMLASSFTLAYFAIKIVSNVVFKVISFAVGTGLLMLVLSQVGVTIPGISHVSEYAFSAMELVFENLKGFTALL